LYSANNWSRKVRHGDVLRLKILDELVQHVDHDQDGAGRLAA